MANTILITANWHTGALSQQTISRQYDNNRYVVQFVGYPEASEGNELDYYLLVWMSTAPGQKPGEITPIQLNSDQWYISNYFTQQVQVIKFQLCALNEAGTYEAHSPIFSGRIGDSLEHDGTSQDIDVPTLFDAYREYIEELIIGAGAVIVDPVPTQGSNNAVRSGGVFDALHDTDTTLTQSGQAADAKATGEIKAELNRFDGGSVNLLNPSEFMEGKYIVAGGGLSDNSGLTVSGFFKVEGSTTYYFYRSDTYKVRVCFYTDESKEGYINQSLIEITSPTATTFVTPAGAKYARISTNKTMILDMGIYTTDIRYYIPYKLLLADGIGIDNHLDPTLSNSKKASPADVVGEIKKHVVFPEKCIKYGDSGMIVDERLDLTTGNIVKNSSNQIRTDFIPVSVGDYLQTCAIRDICLYNDQFEYLGYINLWSSGGNVTPPTSWSGNYRSNIVQIEAIDGVNPSYIRCWGVYNQYPPAVTFLDNKPYEVLNLADSIFGNNEKPWDLGTYIQNITGLKSANCGYGGTTARVITSGNMSPLGLPSIVDCIVSEDFTPLKTPSYWAGVSEYMYTVPTLLFPMVDFSKIKIITIAYGTNDYNSNTPLDNTENRLDTSTYCGGLRYAIEHLQAKYPGVIIMLFSPIYRYWSDSSDYSTVDRDSDSRTNTLGLKLTDYVDAMKSVADEYHLPYFDNYRNIGLNRYTAPAWLRDGTHLNRTRGVEKLGHRVAREVETVY